MRVLFLHNNFPAQYKHVAAALAADPANQIVAGSLDNKKNLPGVTKHIYKPQREPRKDTHHYLRSTEAAVLDGQAVVRMCGELRKSGFIPDLICGHSGWGTTIYTKDVFPEARLLTYFEWYYNARNSDVDFMNKALTWEDLCRVRTRNLPILMDLAHSDWGLCPTRYQLSQIPRVFHSKLTQLHDGVDTDFFMPSDSVQFDVPGLNLRLTRDAEVVTYATRGMEPYRGFPQFMQAVEILQQRRPNLQVVIAGTDRVAYGKKLPEGESYKGKALDELKGLDHSRLHFVGHLPFDMYRNLLQLSSVHVYLTIPFVLSWSLLEAMSTGCLVVGSDTLPVRELIEEGRNGLMTDMFNIEAMAARIEDGLNRRDSMGEIRANARQTILERYALRDLLPRHLQLMRDLAEGRAPAESAAGRPLAVGAAGRQGGGQNNKGASPRSGRPGNIPRGKRRRRH
jgi:glycosyltransferase involved in cell wall biosynthesis